MARQPSDFFLEKLHRKVFHCQNTAAQKNITGIEQCNFDRDRDRRIFHKFNDAGIVAVFGKDLADIAVREFFFNKLCQISAAAPCFHTADRAAAADVFDAIQRNVAQLRGNTVGAHMDPAVDIEAVSHSGPDIDAQNSLIPVRIQVHGPDIMGQKIADIMFYKG